MYEILDTYIYKYSLEYFEYYFSFMFYFQSLWIIESCKKISLLVAKIITTNPLYMYQASVCQKSVLINLSFSLILYCGELMLHKDGSTKQI